jgi:hypothetical protein
MLKITSPLEINISLNDELTQKIDKISEKQKNVEGLLSSYENKLLAMSNNVVSSESVLDEKISHYDKIMKELMANIDQYLMILHTTEEYVNEYNNIIYELPKRAYIDVYGEKILVTKSDALHSPVLASVLKSENKILDLVDPYIFKEILKIIRNFYYPDDRHCTQIMRKRISDNMKKLKIDTNKYAFLNQ